MKTKLLLFCIMCAISINVFSEGKAPDFTVTSGDKKNISLVDLSDRVILCFYETKETENVNAELKDKITDLFAMDFEFYTNQLFILGVADCSASNFLVKKLWQDGLIKKSNAKGFTVYGDWNGGMRDGYHFKRNDSNFIIIDKNGLIRFRASGLLSSREIVSIIDLVKKIIKE